MNTIIIPNFLDEKEIDLLVKYAEEANWRLIGSSIKNNIMFWYKDLFNSNAANLFCNKLQNGLSQNIEVDRIYVNGQAHSQCGIWHTDVPDTGVVNHFTLVYFFKEWLPEYGGHLLIREVDGTVSSHIPEFNKGIIFDSTLEHMGLEPSIHCKTQRESLAVKFRIII